MQSRRIHPIQEEINGYLLRLSKGEVTGLPPFDLVIKAVKVLEFESSYDNYEYLEKLYFAIDDLLSPIGHYWFTRLDYNQEAGTYTHTQSSRYFGECVKTSKPRTYNLDQIVDSTGTRGPCPITGIVADIKFRPDGEVEQIVFAEDAIGHEIPKLWKHGQPTDQTERENVERYLQSFEKLVKPKISPLASKPIRFEEFMNDLNSVVNINTFFTGKGLKVLPHFIQKNRNRKPAAGLSVYILAMKEGGYLNIDPTKRGSITAFHEFLTSELGDIGTRQALSISLEKIQNDPNKKGQIIEAEEDLVHYYYASNQ